MRGLAKGVVLKLFHYRAPGGNFGDDMNAACWGRAWPDYSQCKYADWLVGIGSIFDGRLNSLPGTKLIMGSGYRPTKFGKPDLRQCRFGFVRGPLTCRALGLDEHLAITDAAALMGIDRPHQTGRDSRAGFMPHFHTYRRFDCRRLCEMAGVRLIDPSGPVDEVLQAISESPVLQAEAMHGAILADAMGVPWKRISLFNRRLEGEAKVDFKWQDWAASLDVDGRPAAESLLRWPGRGPFGWLKNVILTERSLRDAAEMVRISSRSGRFQCSNRDLLRSKVERMYEKIQEINSWHVH